MTEPPTAEQLRQHEQIVAAAMELARDGRTAELTEFLDHGFPVDLQDPAGADLDAGSTSARATAQVFGQEHLIDGQE